MGRRPAAGTFKSRQNPTCSPNPRAFRFLPEHVAQASRPRSFTWHRRLGLWSFTWHRRLACAVSRGTGGSPVRFKVIEASQTPSSMPSTLLLENLCRTFLSKMLSRSRALRERSGLLHHLHSSHCSSGGYFVAVFLPRRYSCTPWAWTLGEPCPPLLCGAGGSPAGPCGMDACPPVDFWVARFQRCE